MVLKKSNKSLVFASSFALLLSVTPIFAVAQDSDIPQDIKDEINQSLSNSVNAITAFTSQNSVSSGHFSFDLPNEEDFEFDVFRIPYQYTFGEQNDSIRPFLAASIGNMRFTESYPDEEGGETEDFSKVSTWTFGLGGGIEWKALEKLTIIPKMSFDYSHFKRRFDFNNQFSQEYLTPYDRDVFNTSVDIMTYSPSIKMVYDESFDCFDLKLWTKYAHLFNHGFHSKSSFLDVDAETGILQNSVEGTAPLSITAFNLPLSLRTFLVRTDIYHSARRALELGYFYEVGTELLFDTKETGTSIKELAIGVSYTVGEDFSGYSMTFGLDF